MHKCVENELKGETGAVEVAAITLCSLAYANGLIRNNNKRWSNERRRVLRVQYKPVRSYISDSQRSEERKQQRAEEARLESNLQHKERDRKRKLTALPVKVSPAPLYTAIGRVAKILFNLFFIIFSNHYFFPPTYLLSLLFLISLILILSVYSRIHWYR